MLAGPVFQVELLTTARRARYFAIRSFYVLALLFALFSTYESFFVNQLRGNGGEVSVHLMNFFGAQLFYTFSVTQAVTVALLTPAIVAGTIAVEKQRKTLLYLLASDLSSVDIVLGKLAARMLHLFVFILLGLPIFSLLQYFGGLEPWMIAAVYGLTFSGAIFIAGISMYASVIARRARDAIIMAYVFVPAFYIVPTIIGGLIEVYFPGVIEPYSPYLVFVWPGIGALWAANAPRMPMSPSWAWSPTFLYCWSLGLFLVFGFGFIALAALRLRPIAAKGDGKQRQRIGLDNRGRMTVRVIPKPPVSESDPMLWKERYTSRVGGWARLGIGFVQLFLLTAIGCFAFDGLCEAFREMSSSGFIPNDFDRNRRAFNVYVRSVTALIFIFWQIGTAFSAASTITGEREEDTWLSLVSTVLTGREILRAKRLGAILRYKAMGFVLLAILGLGIATGSVHPVGLVTVAALFAATLAFNSALGTYFSLRSKTTMRALGLTLVPLIFLNGGFLLLCLSPVSPSNSEGQASQAIPFVLATESPISYNESSWLLRDPARETNPGSLYYYYGNNVWDDQPGHRHKLRLAMVFYFISVPAYAIAAFLLARRTDRLWNAAAERPTLPGIEPEIEEIEPAPAGARPPGARPEQPGVGEAP